MEMRVSDIDFGALAQGRTFYPSPTAWEDEVLYFLMLDRFSDGRENGYRDNTGNLATTGTTPLFQPGDRGNATATEGDRQQWVEAGNRFVGGTLRGLESKIGYLQRLGITAIWVSPIFKQVPAQQSYHGYGIQNFLDIDPRFGTRDDLVSLVRTAHEHGIRVILDIILNHVGDVFAYRPEHMRCDIRDNQGNVVGREACWQIDDTVYPVQGYRDATGNPTLPFAPVDAASFPDAAIWPAELQSPETFSRRGKIRNWDFDPEFREGDFETLKDIRQGTGPVDDYWPSDAFHALCRCFKFWIALADIDGFRVDTVKHMDDGASRLFTSVIHEFAQSLGKENFYLIGEITGGRQRAFTTLEITGMNAALGIDDVQDKIEYLVKGYRNPSEYFNLFRNSELVQKESHVWFRNKVVTTCDDHDQVRKGDNKSRFAHDEVPDHRSAARSIAVLALLATTMGIPCIYYGMEQQFDGHGNSDRFLREAMFGGAFGPFESHDRHCFDESHPVYIALQAILNLRRDHLALRRGRQYLRQISGNGQDFGTPVMLGGVIRSVVAWSRIFSDREMLLAINTDADTTRTAWVTIDDRLHAAGAACSLSVLHRSGPDRLNQDYRGAERQGGAGERSTSRLRRLRLSGWPASSSHRRHAEKRSGKIP